MIGGGFCYVSYFLSPRCSTEMFWSLACEVHFKLLCKLLCSLQELERYRKLAMRKARDTSRGAGAEKHSRWNTAASSWFQTTQRHFRTALAGCVWYDELLIQWNPDFSNPWFPEPPDISNQSLFLLDLLHSSSIISPPISRTLDFSKLPITQTNFGSREANWPSITRTCENFQTT